MDDEEVFPSTPGMEFPKNFPKTAATIFKRLFRVYAHIYHEVRCVCVCVCVCLLRNGNVEEAQPPRWLR